MSFYYFCSFDVRTFPWDFFLFRLNIPMGNPNLMHQLVLLRDDYSSSLKRI